MSKKTSMLNIGLNKSDNRAKNDFYSTDKFAIDALWKQDLLGDGAYWECACGMGNLSEQLIKYGFDVKSTDLYEYEYGESGIDFLKCKEIFEGNIITNPPFSKVNEFIEKGIQLASKKLYIFGRIQLLESMNRYERIFKRTPPLWVCPFVKRIKCYPLGVDKYQFSPMAYAWFIWDNEDDSNDTKVKWLI